MAGTIHCSVLSPEGSVFDGEATFFQAHALDGRLVSSLAGGRSNDGFLVYPWNGADASGQRVPPGIYVARIKVDAQIDAQGLSQIINVAY